MTALVTGIAVSESTSARAQDDYLPPAGAPLIREDLRGLHFAPAAGIEVGIGMVYPSFHAPLGNALARLGVAIPVTPNFVVVAGGETGIALAIGNGTPTYGYLFQIPLRLFGEAVVSQRLDYRTRRFIHIHLGGTIGDGFTLASQCQAGVCSYVPAALYFSFGFRVGLSFSEGSRSSVGVFVRWDNDLAECQGLNPCQDYIQTFSWNVGWTVF